MTVVQNDRYFSTKMTVHSKKSWPNWPLFRTKMTVIPTEIIIICWTEINVHFGRKNCSKWPLFTLVVHLSYGRWSYFLSFLDALSYTFFKEEIDNLSVQPVYTKMTMISAKELDDHFGDTLMLETSFYWWQFSHVSTKQACKRHVNWSPT